MLDKVTPDGCAKKTRKAKSTDAKFDYNIINKNFYSVREHMINY